MSSLHSNPRKMNLLTRPDCHPLPYMAIPLLPPPPFSQPVPVPSWTGLTCPFLLQTTRTMSPLTQPDCHPFPAIPLVPPHLPPSTSQSLSIPQLLQVKVKLFCWQSGRVNRLWVLGIGRQQERAGRAGMATGTVWGRGWRW